MIERVIFGTILGAIGESFVNDKQWYCFAISVAMAAMFAFDSSTYGAVYGMMALLEYGVGYKSSSWFRLIREKYGW